ncbi:MAG: acyl-CoA dehydrogenase family protein [Pseudomonadota bacterium]
MDYATANWMSDDHRLFVETVQQFFREEVVPHRERFSEQGCVDRKVWDKAGELGILGAAIPEQYGGSGCPKSFDAVTALEQGLSGDFDWGHGLQSIVIHYVIAFGTKAQKEAWLPKMASGEYVCAIGMSEPGAGSDLQAVRTFAEKTGNGYTINGQKTFISNGQTADFILLVARTKKERASDSISLFGIETKDLNGFERGRNLEKMGLAGQDTSELFFNDVYVDGEALLGETEGQGFYQLMQQLPWERLYIALQSIGQMGYMLKQTVAYTKERKAFGKRIFDFQNTRFELAAVKAKYEICKTYVDSCIEKFDAGNLDAVSASIAKYFISDTQFEIADACLQLFGGYGYMKEYPISYCFTAARVQRIYGGTNEIMKELIARSLDT